MKTKKENKRNKKKKDKPIVFMDIESNCTCIRRTIDHDQIIYPKNVRMT